MGSESPTNQRIFVKISVPECHVMQPEPLRTDINLFVIKIHITKSRVTTENNAIYNNELIKR